MGGSQRSARSSRRLDKACRRQLSALHLTAAAGVRDVAARLEELRGRPLWVLPGDNMPAEISGLWIAKPERDYVFHRPGLEGCHLQQAVMHELAHMICGHQTNDEIRDWLRDRCPSLDEIGPVEHVCMRSDLLTEAEAEAELMASMFLARANDVAALVEGDLDDEEIAERVRVEKVFKT